MSEVSHRSAWKDGSTTGNFEPLLRRAPLDSRALSAARRMRAVHHCKLPAREAGEEGLGRAELASTAGRKTGPLARSINYNPKLNFIEITPLSGPLATPAPETASYKYDAFGRRLQKTTGGLTTTFVHDGDQVIAEYESTQLARKYVYGTYIDEPLAMVAPTETLYYHQDRLYNVMAMTNGSGALAERYGYTAYGKRRVLAPGGSELTASAVGNQVGFTGRYHDAETELTYFRARYMDAELGRFVGRDPMGYVDTPTLCGYVRSRPRLSSTRWGYKRGLEEQGAPRARPQAAAQRAPAIRAMQMMVKAIQMMVEAMTGRTIPRTAVSKIAKAMGGSPWTTVPSEASRWLGRGAGVIGRRLNPAATATAVFAVPYLGTSTALCLGECGT